MGGVVDVGVTESWPEESFVLNVWIAKGSREESGRRLRIEGVDVKVGGKKKRMSVVGCR